MKAPAGVRAQHNFGEILEWLPSHAQSWRRGSARTPQALCTRACARPLLAGLEEHRADRHARWARHPQQVADLTGVRGSRLRCETTNIEDHHKMAQRQQGTNSRLRNRYWRCVAPTWPHRTSHKDMRSCRDPRVGIRLNALTGLWRNCVALLACCSSLLRDVAELLCGCPPLTALLRRSEHAS